MSKEKKELNILDTPFGDGMDISFSEDFKENNSVEPLMIEQVESEGEAEDSIITEIPKVVKDLPKEEIESPIANADPIETTESTLKTFASWLGEKGLVDYDEESFEDSEDGLKKLMSETVEKEVQNYKNSLPEDIHKLVEFVEAGGKPKDFIDVYYNNASWNDFKLEDESDHKLVLKEYLKAQGEEEEDITETLDTYEVSGILEKKAKLALIKLQTAEKGYQEQILESQKKYDSEQKILAKKQYDDFKAELYAKEEIQGFKLTPKVKDNLWDFIMKADKTGKTGLQKHNETNKNSQFMYAYLAMNDWDMTKLEKQVKNKVHSDLADKLTNFKDGRSKLKSGQSDSFGQEKSASDFSAFRVAIDKGIF